MILRGRAQKDVSPFTLEKVQKAVGKYAISNAAEMKKLVICSFTLEHTDAALNVIQYAYLC